MLAKVLSLCLLALVAGVHSKVHKHDQPSPDSNVSDSLGEIYRTVEARLLGGVELRRGPSYLLRAGQCNVTLSARELCGEELVVASVEVTVTSQQSFAAVVVQVSDLQQVTILLDSCPEPAAVDLRLGCLRHKLSRSHSRVPLLLP